MSTIKVDDGLKDELARIQSVHRESLSYNDIVWNAVRSQMLAPILMRYIRARIDDWNPYDLLSWFYEVEQAPMGRELVEAYAELIEETMGA
ncbi:MAG: hypothetical protein NWF07_01460 [Candidatus Bathyarchaeota archaeon]|nr:hypothetical protein [Candidatus Bathyarchaeota archaeon]